MNNNKIIVSSLMVALSLALLISFNVVSAQAADWSGVISAIFYDEDANIGMSADEFNDFEARAKKSYLVLEGSYESIYRVVDPAMIAKYKNAYNNAHSAKVSSYFLPANNDLSQPTGAVLLPTVKSGGRSILELPAGLYVIKSRVEFRPKEVTKDYVNNRTWISHGKLQINNLYSTVKLQAGEHLFYTKDQKFNASANAVLVVHPRFRFVMAYGTPEAKEKEWPIKALFTEKSKNKKDLYLSAFSLREISIFKDKNKFGFKMIHNPKSPGLGYVVSFVEPSLHAWYSGLRAGDAITAVKGLPSLTPQTAFNYFKEGVTLLVKRFDTGKIEEIVLKKKKNK